MPARGIASNRIILTQRDREIVRWVELVRVTTREQVQRMFFGSGGRSRCQERLTLLVRNRYLDKLSTGRVNDPLVYHISRRSVNGRRLLRADRPGRESSPSKLSPARLEHTLEVVSCRVQIARSCLETGMSLLAWRHEDELVGLTAREGIVPDAYFQLARTNSEGQEKRSAFFLEVERSGKTERALKEKLRRYGEFYYSGRFEQTFGGRALRVLVLVGSDYGIKPERQIERLTELSEGLGTTLVRTASLATFTSLPPREALLARIWRRPGATQLSSLFDSPTGSSGPGVYEGV